MGVYEIITGITKNEENLKVEIRQTEGTLERLHSDMYGCNEKTLDRIEHALGIKLETWQSEYLRKAGIGVPKVTLKLDVKRRREDGMRWN